jgi:dolichol-phosphate mannosyltransferase
MFDYEIIVIDDGSDIPLTLNETYQKTTIIRNEKNSGKGYSILKGINESVKRKNTFSIVIDADFQHDPKDIFNFLKKSDTYDLIIGYRAFKNPMPLHRVASNKITSLIISFIIKKNIRDSQCGFRMYRNSLFKNTSFREMGFQFESEFLLKLGSNIKIKQVPIKTTYNNNKSHISKTKDTIKFIKLIIRYLAYGK